MDLIQLTYFIEVARYKSFTKASRALHVSQPSISKGIRTLEEHWGQKLFKRRGRSIELTDVGNTVFPQIESIISQCRELDQQMHESKNLESGTLMLGIPPMIGSSFLSPLLREFVHRYPQISLQIEEKGSDRIAKDIIDGKLRLGFVALPIAGTSENVIMDSYPFNREPMRFVISSDNTFRLPGGPIHISDLQDIPMIFYTNTFSLYHILLARFQQAGIHPRIVAQSDNWDFIAEMVKNNLGAAILPDRICRRLPAHDFTILPIEPVIEWSLAMVWDNRPDLPAPIRLWLSFFKNRMPELSDC